MLDKIMDVVGGAAVNEMTSKAGISVDQAKQMLPLAQESLSEGLLSQITSGNMEGLLGLFNSAGGSGLLNNSIFQSLKGLFIRKIMSSIGLPESVAGLAAGSGLTTILGGMAGMMRQDGENEGIDITNILNVLGVGGGAAGMLGSLINSDEKSKGGLLDSLMDTASNSLGGTAKDKKQDSNLLGGLIKGAGALFGK